MNFATGSESFSEVIESGACYVDKTACLKPLFLTHQVKNPLFIRPRRFGKPLNLSMIKAFCELYYHGFLPGVPGPAASSRSCDIESETLSGEGGTDIIIKQNSTAAVLELKRGENTIKGRLKACEDAKQQIVEKDYARELSADGYTAVYWSGPRVWG